MLSAVSQETRPPSLCQAFVSARQRITWPAPIAGLASARTSKRGEVFSDMLLWILLSLDGLLRYVPVDF